MDRADRCDIRRRGRGGAGIARICPDPLSLGEVIKKNGKEVPETEK